MIKLLVSAVATAVLFGLSSQAMAQDMAVDAGSIHTLRDHPAVMVKRQAPSLDTNRFILAHPAQLMVIATPSPTYAHPAVAVQRMARQAELDRYMAQPPVAAAWLRHSPVTASNAGAASGG